MSRPTRSQVNPGRLAALRALVATERGEHAEDALEHGAPAFANDRALALHLVLGVLRHRPGLDSIIEQAARRTVQNMDPPVVAALRIGVFELRFSRVPPHAAVDQAVEACRAVGAGHASGFVNAVLRNQGRFEPASDTLSGHPAWLAERWRARWGDAADQWMEANNRPAAVYLVAKEDPAGVARAFQHAGFALTPVAETIFRLPEHAGAVESLPGFEEGAWWIMDPAACAVADLVGDFEPGTEILDACAAPGGKSFRLASRGARVFATDVDDSRLDRLRDGAERLDLPVWAEVHDWTTPMERRFSVAVVDAPCTGLGTLRRHPDIRWRRRPSDITTAVERQKRILANVAASITPGGVLVYAVCSPEPEEGPEVAATLGWTVEATFANAPAVEGEDAFWGCRMRAPA